MQMEPEPNFLGGRQHWSDAPWFLQEHDQLFEQAAFPRSLRERATRQLVRLYTADVCREVFARGDGRLIAPLYLAGWPLMVAHLLEVGLDLEVVSQEAAAPITKRLLVDEQFRDAAFELRVWASLVCSGFAVSRVQESEKKATDFVVRRDALEVDLEVKMVNEAAVDEVADEINEAAAAGGEVVPGLALRLEGNEVLGKRLADRPGRAALLRDKEAIVRAFRDAVEALKSVSSPVGRHPVDGYGWIDARSTRTHPNLTPDLFPQQSDEMMKAKRVLRLLRDACEQASRKRPLVCVIGVFHKANLVTVEQELRAAVKDDPKRFHPCEMLVLVDLVRNNLEEFKTTPLCYPIVVRLRRELTRCQFDLAIAAGGSRIRRAQPVRAAAPGEPSLALGPARKATTRVLLQRLESDAPGSPLTFAPLDPEGKNLG